MWSDDHSSPVFESSQFIANESGADGGAVWGNYSAPSFTDCVFENNRSDGNGGALFNWDNSSTSSLFLRNCTFSGNIARYSGGGVWCQGNSGANPPITIVSCAFTGNASRDAREGGGVYVTGSRIRLINCQFRGNLAHYQGAGLYGSSPAYFQMVNSLVVDNWGSWGGGMYLSGPGAGSEIVNCTVTGNQGDVDGGGAYLASATQLSVRNSIFWGNTAPTGPQIGVSGASPTVQYSDVQGGWSDTGNINVDPQFVRADQGHYQLRGDSDCVDAGTNTGLPSDDQDVDADQNTTEKTPDLDGRTRVVPAQGTVDMGAYEYEASPDCNENEIADGEDIATGTSQDCNGNGVPDECEVAASDGCAVGLCVQNCLPDCNQNCVPDACDIARGTSHDCQPDGVPDECPGQLAADCNQNCFEDDDDIYEGRSEDCNGNGIPDECESGAIGRWDSEEDFTRGTLINVSWRDGALQRNTVANTKPLPYLWIAASGVVQDAEERVGTIVRINVVDGHIEGEYLTAPVDRLRNPSRTTVDLDGSVWAGNRDEETPDLWEGDRGSIVKIGLVVGGARVDEYGMPKPDGQYLKPPFQYCTCEDRDGDGLIKTSRGAGDVLPWPNTRGADTDGGVTTASDECIVRYIRTSAKHVRTLAVDDGNNLWIGGYTHPHFPYVHEKRNGFSGDLMVDPFPAGAGGYGGLVAHAYYPQSRTWSEILWSAKGGNGLLRYITDTGAKSWTKKSGDYGLGFDPLTAHIWHSVGDPGNPPETKPFLYEIDPALEFVVPDQDLSVQRYYRESHFRGGKGVAVDNRGHVWVAEYLGDEVVHLRPDPPGPHVIVGYISGFNNPTGVAVDAFGKVWVSEQDAGRVSRIDPEGGPENPEESGYHIGAVDLSVPLGFRSAPYNYSDMTGMVGLHTSGTGTWVGVHDGLVPGTTWEWASVGQSGQTRPELGVRAADTEAALALNDYSLVQGGQIVPQVTGRFVQVRARFHGSYPHPNVPFSTPKLSNLVVVPRCSAVLGDLNGDSVVNALDIAPFVATLLRTGPECYASWCAADMNHDSYVNEGDIPCFVEKLLTGTSSCGGNGRGGRQDCNENGIADANDIANQTSQDCNHNFVPDECDIDPADPDGDGLVSNDLNANGIPDECEADCNQNGVPDDKDIADQTSNDVNDNDIPDECEIDCNQNGVPDDWDIAQQTSEDCNSNGRPDECDADCNQNDVPDDCDIAAETSLDCNGNGVPDECDLGWAPPRGSLDCNDNGVPDECDIADCQSDPACADCNGNGFPDGCDIAAQISLDENENGVPDECEGGENGMLGGGYGESSAEGLGGELTGGSSEDMSARLEALEEFRDWCQAQSWGPSAETTGSEQFQAMTAKLRELGLPAKRR